MEAAIKPIQNEDPRWNDARSVLDTARLLVEAAIKSITATRKRHKSAVAALRRADSLLLTAVSQFPALRSRDFLSYILEQATDALRRFALSDDQLSAIAKSDLQKKLGTLNELVAKNLLLIAPSPPLFVYDPAEFKIAAHLVALTLLAQKPNPLSSIGNEYGAGVYALFYKGDLPCYAPIKGEKFPIYVGSAVPESPYGKTPEEQGTMLAKRLREHFKTIRIVEQGGGNLKVSEFVYKHLCVRSGWELAVEQYLIRYFKPVWNKETKICQGFGKHGDSPQTRANKRSQWDTLHWGRKWAISKGNVDNVPSKAIEDSIKKFFADQPPRELQTADLFA
jgi:hypothetical protein